MFPVDQPGDLRSADWVNVFDIFYCPFCPIYSTYPLNTGGGGGGGGNPTLAINMFLAVMHFIRINKAKQKIVVLVSRPTLYFSPDPNIFTVFFMSGFT